MNVSESWLRERINLSESIAEIADELTMAGLEVDGLETLGGHFSKVVVGEIVECAPHPDAEKLRVCQVKGSPDADLTQVVCGAPNARVGIKIPFALVGASLPPSKEGEKAFKIKKAKLRGVESFGMLCGASELECGEDTGGLWELPTDLAVGQELQEALNLKDTVVDIDLTPNRSDCLSIHGIARELGVIYRQDLNPLSISAVESTIDDSVTVSVPATEACPKYLCRVIKLRNCEAQTPLWMSEKLRRAGIGSKTLAVDVTNYVMIELGQPMHAFDLQKLDGDVQVRFAKEGEEIVALNGEKLPLKSDTLVIADDSGSIAVAGVIGGERTAVDPSTTEILLEAAHFSPSVIAGKARSLGLHTDSSHRFERGVDPCLPEQAIERATQLIIEIAEGQAGQISESSGDITSLVHRSVTLQRENVEKGLGFAIPDEEILEILRRLGLDKQAETSEGWTFDIPSYRFDISIEADLLEELARIYGYNRLPSRSPKTRLDIEMASSTEKRVDKTLLKQFFVSRGYSEAITYSFTDPKWLQAFGLNEATLLLNPISEDLSAMRPSLVPGLVQALSNNLKRQHASAMLFETGLRFSSQNGQLDDISQQIPTFSALIHGKRAGLEWSGKSENVDFFDLKGDIEAWFASIDAKLQFVSSDAVPAYLHPGRSAFVTHIESGRQIGYVGELHPATVKRLDLPTSPVVCEFDLASLLEQPVPAFSTVSRFPAVDRDLAVLVNRELESGQLSKAIQGAAGEHLKHLKVFDIYTGEGIDNKEKSIAFNLTYQHPSRTLKEDEITKSINNIVAKLDSEFGARLR